VDGESIIYIYQIRIIKLINKQGNKASPLNLHLLHIFHSQSCNTNQLTEQRTQQAPNSFRPGVSLAAAVIGRQRRRCTYAEGRGCGGGGTSAASTASEEAFLAGLHGAMEVMERLCRRCSVMLAWWSGQCGGAASCHVYICAARSVS
jgi:hypothetical protein